MAAKKRIVKPATKKAAKKKAAKKKPAKKKPAATAKRAKKKRATKKTAAKKKAGKQKAAKKKTASSTSGKGAVEGKKAPSFSLSDQDGKTVSSADLSGRAYVLYFYPRDDTPGCTKEACGFRDDMARFHRVGILVIGVSPDKPATHVRFRQKYGLGFPLVSDVDKVAAKAFGSWVKKQNYGREYMGIDRSTFLVDAKGVVRKIWRRVKVVGHVEEVLDAALAL